MVITKGNSSIFIPVAIYSLLFLTMNTAAAQPAIQPGKQTAASPINHMVLPSEYKAAREKAKREAKEIQSLLKEQFKVIKREPSSSNPYPTLVPRLSEAGTLDAIDSKYEVFDIQPFDDKGFFRQQKILLVSVNDIFLQAYMRMGSRSAGMFALNGTKLTYLNGLDSTTNVTDVLRRENRSLSEVDPQMLAKFFAMTILRQDNDRIDVVQSPADILKLDKPNAAKMNEMIKKKHMGRLYATTVDKIELEKCKPFFIKPQLSGDAKSGWQYHFMGLNGFMHTIRVPFSLINYTVSISPTYDIKVSDNILSSKIIN